MKLISQVLIEAGFDTFLPQEDGIEFSQASAFLQQFGMSAADAGGLLSRAIFALDVYKLIEWSDAVVANFNGRVPDEGTVVEAALGWHAGKAVILYKADSRSLLNGSDNPMWTGLGAFDIVSDIRELPQAVSKRHSSRRNAEVTNTLDAGRKIASTIDQLRGSERRSEMIARLVRELFQTAK
jgi:hypothetical protein